MKRSSFFNGWTQIWWRRLIERADNSEPHAIIMAKAKTIYIPIPKAANSSARGAILPTLGLDPKDFPKIQRDTKHLTVPFSQALAQADASWFIFTIVRDPSARAYSAWLNKLDQHAGRFRPLKSMGLQKGDSFEKFLWVLRQWPLRLLNDHFIPQHLLLAKAATQCDLNVYKVEDLAAGWPEICDRIEAQGGVRPLDMPHLNKSPREKVESYSALARKRLLQLYSEDYAVFDYPKPA